jgi:hypothetical protein
LEVTVSLSSKTLAIVQTILAVSSFVLAVVLDSWIFTFGAAAHSAVAGGYWQSWSDEVAQTRRRIRAANKRRTHDGVFEYDENGNFTSTTVHNN